MGTYCPPFLRITLRSIMKKVLMAILIGLFSLTGSAQIVSSTSRNIPTTTTVVPKEKKTYFGIDVSVGKMATKVEYWDESEKVADGAFGLGFHWERHYNPYIAWDVFSVFWDSPFDSPSDLGRLGFKTGVRGFSPRFFRNMRGYANLDLGYSLNYLKSYCYDCDEDEIEISHGFGLEFGFGLRLTDHVGVGYALDWDSDTKLKGNYLRLSFLF